MYVPEAYCLLVSLQLIWTCPNRSEIGGVTWTPRDPRVFLRYLAESSRNKIHINTPHMWAPYCNLFCLEIFVSILELFGLVPNFAVESWASNFRDPHTFDAQMHHPNPFQCPLRWYWFYQDST